MSSKAWAATAAMGLVLAGCAEGSLTSAYLSPEEGVLYRYGNFCGPGNPVRVSDDPNTQLNHIISIEPQDSIDFVCKMHDMCFEQRGHDNPSCDYAIVGALRYTMATTLDANADTAGPRMQCINLAGEIMTPFTTKYSQGAAQQSASANSSEAWSNLFDSIAALGGNDEAAARVSAREGEEPSAQDEGLAGSILTGALVGIGGLVAGFPEQPGMCQGARFDAIQANFQCHSQFFDTQFAGGYALDAVRLSTMETNGCKDMTDATYGG